MDIHYTNQNIPDETREQAMLLISTLLRGKGLKHFMDICCDTLENPVVLCDPGGSWFIVSNKFNKFPPDILELVQTGKVSNEIIEAHERMDTGGRSKGPRAFLLETDVFSESRRIAYGINVDEQLVAILTVHEANRALTAKDQGILEFLGQIITREIQSNGTPQSALYEYQLQEMLRGERFTDSQIEAWLTSLRWQGSNAFQICVVCPEESRRYIVETTLRRKFGERMDCKVTRLKEHIILLLNIKSRSRGQALLRDLEEELKETELRGAVSSLFTSLSELRAQYELTCEAVELGELVNPEQVLAAYEDVFSFSLIHAMAKHGDVSRYILPQITRLKQYDAQYGTEYCLTLTTLIYSEHKIAVAKALNIHKNTLKYRLEKIREITNMDLDDKKTLFALQQSMLIEEYLKRRELVSPGTEYSHV